MSRYTIGASENYIYYPNTAIPINLLDIKDEDNLRAKEAELLAASYLDFHNQLTESTVFDENYFRNLHLQTFSTLYPFAGKFRNHDVSKGDSQFCKAKYIHSELQKLFVSLKSEHYLKNIDEKLLIDRIAFYMCELITIHPFPELNGRIIRMFFDLILLANGYEPIDYHMNTEAENPASNYFIDASIQCVQCADSSGLALIIKNGLNRA